MHDWATLLLLGAGAGAALSPSSAARDPAAPSVSSAMHAPPAPSVSSGMHAPAPPWVSTAMRAPAAPSGSSAVRSPAPPCQELCRRSGRCTVTPHGCRATRKDDCRRSLACYESGACSLDRRYHACRVASSEDCERSSLCRTRGQCTYDDGLATCLGRVPLPSDVKVIGGALLLSGVLVFPLTVFSETFFYQGSGPDGTDGPAERGSPTAFRQNPELYDAFLVTSGVVALTGAAILLVSLISTPESVSSSSGITVTAQGLSVPFDPVVR